MLPAIKLNDEAFFKTDKINDEIIYGLLAAEFQAL